MLFVGNFARSMDEKQRIPLPKRVRDTLGTQVDRLYVTPWTDATLAIFTEERLAALGSRLEATSPTRQDVRTYSRLFYARAEHLDLDDQGRFRLPAELVQLAQLRREVMLVGVNDRLEIWNKTEWEKYLAQHSANYDRLAEQALDDGNRS